MNRDRFSYKTTSSEETRCTGLSPAQLVVTLNTLLFLLGSLALAATLGAIPPPLSAAARAQHTHSLLLKRRPLTRFQAAPDQQAPLRTILFHGNTRLQEVALTFDDGPTPWSTPQILATLNHFGVKATFFCIGQQVQIYPAVVRQEYADGDLIEDHSWSHPDMRYLSASAIHKQLEMGAQAIEQVTNTEPAFFRPPYGSATPIMLSQARQLDLSTVMWTIDPRDWSLPGSQVIISRVLSSVTNGAIILLHDGGGNRAQTIAALPTIITKLQQRGFRFVTIQQMVEDM